MPAAAEQFAVMQNGTLTHTITDECRAALAEIRKDLENLRCELEHERHRRRQVALLNARLRADRDQSRALARAAEAEVTRLRRERERLQSALDAALAGQDKVPNARKPYQP